MKPTLTCDEAKAGQDLIQRLARWIHGTQLPDCNWQPTVNGRGEATMVEQHCDRCGSFRYYMGNQSNRWEPGRHPWRLRCWAPAAIARLRDGRTRRPPLGGTMEDPP